MGLQDMVKSSHFRLILTFSAKSRQKTETLLGILLEDSLGPYLQPKCMIYELLRDKISLEVDFSTECSFSVQP